MRKAIDLMGLKFGRLMVLERNASMYNRDAAWLCQCECGNQKVVVGRSLRNGDTTSCGCYAIESRRTHGETTTKEYGIWANMKTRCFNPNRKTYINYGGRGITICDRWINSYENFLEDMGTCPEGLTIERIDNNGDYEPGNCKWATTKEQAYNTRRNVWIEYGGKRMVRNDWIKKVGIVWGTWRYWLKKGLTEEEVLRRFIEV